MNFNIFLVVHNVSIERRIPIGIIKRNVTEGVRFEYLQEGLQKAKMFGFDFYVGFPNTSPGKVYKENVLEIVGQRLMRSERNDINDFYEFWKVNKRFKEDAYYMLAQTQGLLPTDNFEFLAEFNPVKGLSFVTEVSGLSTTQIDGSLLKIGDRLTYQLEHENPFDKYAVKVFKDNLDIGYIKLIHSKLFHQSKTRIDLTVQHIEKNGVLRRLFVAVSLK